ncbi:MAG: sigma-70 family RNA polymerase sigma factor [Fuerstiella sp.]|nr:sigma-70 family RNA polymerase sigma factor [Fuerstiella sp.]
MSELTAPSVEYSLLNDRDLLRRFVQDADELAFAEIVRRHQGLVMGVCRRVIGNAADIDDAFQATFITLARRPRQIRRESSLSSWLYTVAWRTSIRLVRQRRKHPVEPLTTDPSDKPQPVDASEAVDEKYTLVELVQEMTTPPCRWVVSDGEGGAIKIVGRSLVVRQTQAGHREIVRLLNLLTESIGDPN